MFLFLFTFYFIGILSILFLNFSLLSVLISMEFLIVILFFVIYLSFYSEGIMELVSFLVLVTGESVLGIILMLMKVGFDGLDLLDEFYLS